MDLLRDGPLPLRARLTELLAGMLLDRAQARGDHADADAALTLLGLLPWAGTEPEPGDLNDMLASAGPPALAELLTPAPHHGPPDLGGTVSDSNSRLPSARRSCCVPCCPVARTGSRRPGRPAAPMTSPAPSRSCAG